MEGRNRAGKIGYISFYIGLFLELLIVIVDKSDWQNIYESRMFKVAFCFFVLTILCTRYTVREYLLIGLVGLFSLISWRVSGRDEPVRFVVFCAACKSIPLRPMMKRVFWATFAGCSFLVFLSVTGIFGIKSITLDFGRGMEQTRYCLGLGHPNALHCMFLMLLILGLYLYYQKILWWGYLMLLFVNGAMYLLTDSRMGTAVGLGALALGAWMRFWPGVFERRWVYWLGALFLTGLPLLSAWLTMHYSHALDRVLNMRLWDVIMNAHAQAANWTLFSGKGSDVYFDMGFVRLFYWYGLLPGIFVILALAALCLYAGRRRDKAMLLLLLCCSVYTMIEAHLVSVYIGRCYPLMLLGCSWGTMLHPKGGRDADCNVGA